ncbi:uncharacterized protein I303_100850 [Kwoniella dejecticola CBS 10117]|uniref:Uncharacterized protein n=1 Tax=Kwoniella dejecticola CBS 10117 TaxID=1296121 RepID=A0A1A6AG70_9TREE|nr:uncharacterized protein I303_00853 [Kwoniella dejecticola CBS 10117]OBR89031.1 hypothetical protein I303_00853 [Kwoniella dejecticola CBS 10117]
MSNNANTNAYAAGTEKTTVPGTQADGSAGANAAQGLGDKVKGGWNVFHGAGEAIRGNANSFIDNLGEQVAGRDPAQQPQTRSAGGERPAGVAAKGADEIQQGVAEFRK